MAELKRAGEDLRLVFARQFLGWLERKRKPRLVEGAGGVFLELHAERWHDIECGAKAWHFATHLHHAPVILHGMEPRPRQNVLPGFRIAILRLVHVPQNHQVYAVHQKGPFRCESALVFHSPFSTCASWTATSSAKFLVMPSLDSSFSRSFFSCRN